MVTQPDIVDFNLSALFISPHWISLVVSVEFHEQLGRHLCDGDN